MRRTGSKKKVTGEKKKYGDRNRKNKRKSFIKEQAFNKSLADGTLEESIITK